MSSLLILCIAFRMCFGFGTSELCDGSLHKLEFKRFQSVRPRGLFLKIPAPRNITGTSFCEITNGYFDVICYGFNLYNWSWPAYLEIRCDRPGYSLHVSQPIETLLHCSGQIIHQLVIQNCSISWWDISQLAIFTNPKVIVLRDVSHDMSRLNISDMAAVPHSSIHVRTGVIIFDSTTTYNQKYMTTLELHYSGLTEQLRDSLCIPCQMKNQQNAVQYQKSIRTFPTQRFTKLQIVKFSDINMTAVSDLQGFGEISALILVNCGLKSFPLWRVVKIRQRLNASPFEKVLFEQGSERFFRLNFLSAPDSPLQYKDHPILNTLFLQLRSQYYLKSLDLSLNPIKEIPYFEGMARLDAITLKYNDLHGSTISNLSFATNLLVLDLSFNALEYLPENLFNGYRQLEYLKLNYCNLRSLGSFVDQNLKSLKLLAVAGNLITFVPQELFLLPRLLGLEMGPSPYLSNLTLPQKVFTSSLTYIVLFGTHLRAFPAELLTSLFPSMGDMVLWGNELDSEGMITMVQLKKDRVRSGQRGVVILLFNCIEYIPLAGQREVETLDRVLDSFTLYLHQNPIHCGCEEMIAWLQSIGVKNTFAIKCSRESMWLASRVEKKMLSYLPMSRCDKYIRGPYPYQCSADIHKDKVVKLTTATILGLTAVIVLIVVLKRQCFYLQQWLFILTGLRLYHRVWQRRPFKYDAFVCYCGDDYRWVFQTLLPGLEEDCDPPYSLCVHDRDFVVGKDIADNVMNAMEASRAVVLVLSPNSAQSEWCGFEINAAIEERILGTKPLPIIPVILDHVNLQAFTRKQRRVLKKIPSMLAADRNLIAKLRFILGNPLTIQEDNCGPRQGAGLMGAGMQAGDMGAGVQAGLMGAGEQAGDMGAYEQAGAMVAGLQAGNMGAREQTEGMGTYEQTVDMGAYEQAGDMGAGLQTWLMRANQQAGDMGAGEQSGLMAAGEQESSV